MVARTFNVPLSEAAWRVASSTEFSAIPVDVKRRNGRKGWRKLPTTELQALLERNSTEMSSFRPDVTHAPPQLLSPQLHHNKQLLTGPYFPGWPDWPLFS